MNRKPKWMASFLRPLCLSLRRYQALLAVLVIFLIFAWRSKNRLNSPSIFDPDQMVPLFDLSSSKIIVKKEKFKDLQHIGINSNANGNRISSDLTPPEFGCKLAELIVDDPDIAHLFKAPTPLTCHEKELNWVEISDSKFKFTDHAQRTYRNLSCTYLPIKRGPDDNAPITGHRDLDQPRLPLTAGDKIADDFVHIKCTGVTGSLEVRRYVNVHATAARDEKVAERAKSRRSMAGADRLNLNVYIMGFDSVSRMTFMRKLPKTYNYLTKNMSGVVLEGYNIVGDGTPQALIPIFTGQTETELPLTRKRFHNASYVNVYPFVWNDYMKKGYVTLYGEDAAQIGTFTYRLKGFKEQPTDHYMRTFYAATETLPGAGRCQGSEPHHAVHFRYVEDFFKAYPELPKFAFQFHSVYSHDNINDVQLADDFMVEHLQFFQKQNYTNTSILVMMSDHGHRFASLRQTQQGKLEERLPMFAMVLPPWFKDRFPGETSNLQANAKRLTTPFDIYATLKEILDLGQDPSVPKHGSRGAGPRSVSLFDKVPAERGCSEAGVEPHWCACLAWSPISPHNPSAVQTARALVAAINQETLRVRKLCAELTLASIDRASHYAPQEKLLKFKMSKDLDGFEPDFEEENRTTKVSVHHMQLTFKTQPGGAIYEGSVKFHKKSNELVLNLDDVSHINAYGDNPHCVIDQDYFLAKCAEVVAQKAADASMTTVASAAGLPTWGWGLVGGVVVLSLFFAGVSVHLCLRRWGTGKLAAVDVVPADDAHFIDRAKGDAKTTMGVVNEIPPPKEYKVKASQENVGVLSKSEPKILSLTTPVKKILSESEEKVPPVEKMAEAPIVEKVPPVEKMAEAPIVEKVPPVEKMAEAPIVEKVPPVEKMAEAPMVEKLPQAHVENVPQAPASHVIVEKMPQAPVENVPQAPAENVPQAPAENVPQAPAENMPQAPAPQTPVEKVPQALVENITQQPVGIVQAPNQLELIGEQKAAPIGKAPKGFEQQRLLRFKELYARLDPSPPSSGRE